MSSGIEHISHPENGDWLLPASRTLAPAEEGLRLVVPPGRAAGLVPQTGSPLCKNLLPCQSLNHGGQRLQAVFEDADVRDAIALPAREQVFADLVDAADQQVGCL